MTLMDMVTTLRTQDNFIEVRDIHNEEIATFPQDRIMGTPYVEKEVEEWFPGAAPYKHATFTVIIDWEIREG